MTAAQRWAAVTHVQEAAADEGHPVSQRRACRWLGVHRTPVRYVTRRAPDTELRDRLRELAAAHPRWGVPRLFWLLRREGRPDNYKRVAQARVPRPVPNGLNARWSMDFVRDTTARGRVFRALTVVDEFTRECLTIEVDTSLLAVRVADTLDRVAAMRGLPASISVDNGPEFAGCTLNEWAHARGVVLDFIRPGKPVDNAYIESFNGRLRDEYLNAHWFLSVADARRQIAAWRTTYNAARSHAGLAGRTPAEFALLHARTPDVASTPIRLTA